MPMKQKILCIAGICIALAMQVRSQTMTGTVLQQPCNNDGKIVVSTTGLALPITYEFYYGTQYLQYPNVSSASFTFTGIAAESQNVVYAYAYSGNNSASQSFTLTLPFTYSTSLTIGLCPSPSTIQVSNISGGTAPYTYNLLNTINMMSYTTNPMLVPRGNYELHVMDAAGCVVAADSSMYIGGNSNIMLNSASTVANCTNGSASVSASNGVAPYSYQWNNGANTPSISGLSEGGYDCTVTDAQGCQQQAYVYVPQSYAVALNTSITNATCLQNNGSVLGFPSGGTAPYTVAWTNGATTQNISGLAGNQSYYAVVTDANGCTGNAYAYVSAATPITVTDVTSPSSCTSATGAATLNIAGGAAPYTVSWSTAPVASGPVISNMPSGQYAFHVTDANGCVQTGVVFIPPVSTINAGISGGSVVCPATQGSLQANVSGTNGPFAYAWSNGATTSSISNVPVGAYHCVITDALGCSVTKSAYVSQTSPINLGLSAVQASCLYNADGMAFANATGGTAPYTYHWSNGYTGASNTGLATGHYYVTATDANGCTTNLNSSNNQLFVGYNAANTSCYCTISGTVYNDANGNCTLDAGEALIPGIMMHCSGMGYAYSNASGVYSFLVPTGTYTISECLQPNYPLAACQQASVATSVTASPGCTNTLNFANAVNYVHDLHVIAAGINLPIPGNSYLQKVIVQNEGTLAESNISLSHVHDGQLALNSSIPATLTQPNVTYPNWYNSTGFPALGPGQSAAITVDYSVPANIPLGTTVNFYDTVAHAAPVSTVWLTDYSPWNNVAQYQSTVIGSFDPNFKEVSPKGTGPAGNITVQDTALTYVIHFQNTGSYFAQNIVLVDSLDPAINVRSLKPGYSDHQYTTSVSENGVIRFSFHNIRLPWQDGYGDEISSGMITYSVKLKPNLPPGTQIRNKAAIYFDYNEPVITNTTLNTIGAPLSVNELNRDGSDIMLYPNPASEVYTLVFNAPKDEHYVLSVVDIEGRTLVQKMVSIQSGTNIIQETTSGIQSGVYIVQLRSENNVLTKKLVISK